MKVVIRARWYLVSSGRLPEVSLSTSRLPSSATAKAPPTMYRHLSPAHTTIARNIGRQTSALPRSGSTTMSRNGTSVSITAVAIPAGRLTSNIMPEKSADSASISPSLANSDGWIRSAPKPSHRLAPLSRMPTFGISTSINSTSTAG